MAKGFRRFEEMPMTGAVSFFPAFKSLLDCLSKR